MTTTRPLGAWEHTDFLAIASAFHAETGLGGAFNPAHCIAQWRLFPERVAIGLYQDTTLVGCLCGIIAPQFFTGDHLAQELFWYVLPEHRGTYGSIQMLKDFEEWAKSRNVFGIVMASLDDGGVANLYKKRGYKNLETHYLKIF